MNTNIGKPSPENNTPKVSLWQNQPLLWSIIWMISTTMLVWVIVTTTNVVDLIATPDDGVEVDPLAQERDPYPTKYCVIKLGDVEIKIWGR